ncbi:indole-3-glycerol phosphate synthase [Mesobacillus campisalis]|uniref:Indole-3-glycerol phosphate synthase n=1 Tax=Mesobacillus campisalis TaxID=1408103 RepID=A0A0M2SVP8_9BACI|nr:indole-3-glycerol phosphate synthase TrpC [Mesobacillus campisalis]KKK37776.1 indole-3-glycerol phosphate synthase [Mesobacillus campisalis]
MQTILDKIIAKKREDIRDLSEIAIGLPQKKHSFIEKLKNASELCIISEFKRASPSKGLINDSLQPAKQAAMYAEYGASAISVLTDSHFKGTMDDLKEVRSAVGLPILCKDFIIERKQITHASAAGADLVLLIASVHDQHSLKELHEYSKELGMEALVEVHDEADLEKALSAGAELVGINNRDLKTFEVKLDTTEKLGPIVRKSGAFLISESGLKTREDVMRAAHSGANGILVGESFMAAADLHQLFRDFKVPLTAVKQL